ncbi:hypothetical protein PHLCEN_2v12099 [Hermanssonia centrifuga]|uniref:alpha-1,2-Mannosidase n=1 Tax=Hermanssonia centrifuga TaxID=98765 RepID=A0A2R6NI80_9APHY|nr:hypothetical protein PHLCEN_2v12099 [Hermanssonia centrifuga]
MPGPESRKRHKKVPLGHSQDQLKPSRQVSHSSDSDSIRTRNSTASSANWLPSLVCLLLIAVAVLAYQNFDSGRKDPGGWFTRLPQWEALPGGTKGAVIDFSADESKKAAVLKKDAMGSDEYHPISRTGTNLTEAGGIGYTVVDSIDTMLIMGLDEEYQRARNWIASALDFDKDANVSTFEVCFLQSPSRNKAKHLHGKMFIKMTIRVMGGLLSAHHLTDDPVYLEKAKNLADRLLPAFNTPSGLPLTWVNLARGTASLDPSIKGLVSTSEVSGMQLEFKYLSLLTDEDIYWKKVEKVMDRIRKAHLQTSLAPIYMRNWRVSPKQDHLACFFGGSLMLGAVTTGTLTRPVSIPPKPEELSLQGKRDWTNGVNIIETCMRTHDTLTGLPPEIAYFRIPHVGWNMNGTDSPRDWYVKGTGSGDPYDARYILRPETIESLFLAFRLTGDNRYRQYGWSIFQAIEMHCRIPTGGYASIVNVDELPVKHEDRMETFMMAHPLPIFYPTIRTGLA